MQKKSKNKSFRVLVAALCVLLIAVGTTVTTVVLTAGDSHGYNGGNVDLRQPTIAVGSGSGSPMTAAINSDGHLYVWGHGNNLGNGTGTTYVPTPLEQSVSNKKWKSISMGHNHTLAIDENDYLYTWGGGVYGQLGNGGLEDMTLPTILDESVRNYKWKVAVAGYTVSVAIDSEGYMYTWGRNNYGQLGIGTSTGSRNIPGELHESVRDKKWKAVAIQNIANSHVLALDEHGKLYTWGYNTCGQLGNGTTTNANIPQPIRHDKTWTAISAGSHFSAAIDDQGDIYTWGHAEFGKLGHGLTEIYDEEMDYTYYTLVDVHTPTLMVSDKKWKAVSAGDGHALAIDIDGYLYGWGHNWHSKLGTNWVLGVDENEEYVPIQPASPGDAMKWSEVIAGDYVQIARNEAGDVYVWGANSTGNNSSGLGLGSDRTGGAPAPEKVTLPAPVIVAHAVPCNINKKCLTY